MKVYEVQKGATSLDGLRPTERADPQPGPREILIRVRAVSLNSRDRMVVTGNYFGGPVTRNLIPLSDGAGEVADVGPEVTRFKTGDRVAGTFFQSWISGPMTERYPALGSPLDGTLAEYIVLHEDGVVALPNTLSFEEAATLPCAAVTAWNALMVSGQPVRPGDTALCIGTGGVSMAALLFAHAAGARVIVTSSSDEKIKRAGALGASDGINYKRFPDWQEEVAHLTGGRGADHIIENGGAGSLTRSFEAAAFGGKIALIGFLAGRQGDINPAVLMMKCGVMIGNGVGSRAMFEEMNRAIDVNKRKGCGAHRQTNQEHARAALRFARVPQKRTGRRARPQTKEELPHWPHRRRVRCARVSQKIKPVVDKVFRFDQAAEAFRCQAAGDFVGKVVIAI